MSKAAVIGIAVVLSVIAVGVLRSTNPGGIATTIGLK